MSTETDNALAGGDDAALFNEMTARDVAEVPATEPAAPTAEPPTPEPAAPVETDASRNYKAMAHEERQQRRALERQMQELIATMQAGQPKPAPTPAPEWFDDPSAFVASQVNPVLQQQHATIMYNARMAAEARFGEGSVQAAEAEFNRLVNAGEMHPAERDRINGSPNPFAEAVKWHKRQTVVSEVGDDLTAYQAKLKAQLLEDPEFRQQMMAKLQEQAGGQPRVRGASPPISLPSLSKIGATALPSGDGNESDADLWSSVTAPKRR